MIEGLFEDTAAQIRNGRDIHLETVKEYFPDFIPYTEAIISLTKEEDRLSHAKKDLQARHQVLDAIDPNIFPKAVQKATEDIPKLEEEIRGYENLVALAKAKLEEEKTKIRPEKFEEFKKSLKEKLAQKIAASGLYPPQNPSSN